MTRILVVEDEPGIALGLEDDLKLEGYEVEVVCDGETACSRNREEIFDLILLDIMLPGKDGFEVCREIRRSGDKTPIILLTAKTQEAEKVLGLELVLLCHKHLDARAAVAYHERHGYAQS